MRLDPTLHCCKLGSGEMKLIASRQSIFAKVFPTPLYPSNWSDILLEVIFRYGIKSLSEYNSDARQGNSLQRWPLSFS